MYTYYLYNIYYMNLLEKIIVFILAIFVLALLMLPYKIYSWSWYWNYETTTEKIHEVTIELVWSWQNLSRKKYVFTDDNVYQVSDRLSIWHTRSMNVFNELRNNEWKTCDIETMGKRIWLFSLYKNIISVKNCK